jgi:hypothetical protein
VSLRLTLAPIERSQLQTFDLNAPQDVGRSATVTPEPDPQREEPIEMSADQHGRQNESASARVPYALRGTARRRGRFLQLKFTTLTLALIIITPVGPAGIGGAERETSTASTTSDRSYLYTAVSRKSEFLPNPGSSATPPEAAANQNSVEPAVRLEPAQDTGLFTSEGDYVHISSTPPRAASAHGWWIVDASVGEPPEFANVTVQLQIRIEDRWVDVGAAGSEQVRPGGGSANRANARVVCV